MKRQRRRCLATWRIRWWRQSGRDICLHQFWLCETHWFFIVLRFQKSTELGKPQVWCGRLPPNGFLKSRNQRENWSHIWSDTPQCSAGYLIWFPTFVDKPGPKDNHVWDLGWNGQVSADQVSMTWTFLPLLGGLFGTRLSRELSVTGNVNQWRWVITILLWQEPDQTEYNVEAPWQSHQYICQQAGTRRSLSRFTGSYSKQRYSPCALLCSYGAHILHDEGLSKTMQNIMQRQAPWMVLSHTVLQDTLMSRGVYVFMQMLKIIPISETCPKCFSFAEL